MAHRQEPQILNTYGKSSEEKKQKRDNANDLFDDLEDILEEQKVTKAVDAYTNSSNNGGTNLAPRKNGVPGK